MRRRILLNKTSGGGGEDIIYDGVDLGLTGDSANIIWATANVGASVETEYGGFYQWGSTVSHVPFDDNDYFFTGDTVLPLSADTAAMLMKGDWRMPTSAECQAFISQTTSAVTTVNGVKCVKFTSSNGKYIFIPTGGRYSNTDINYGSGYTFNCWTSIYGEDDPNSRKLALCFMSETYTSEEFVEVGNSLRRYYHTVRAVKPKYQYVDLGLPSGLKWATANVGAVKETDYGTYFKYGAGNEHYFLDMSINIPYYGNENPLAASADTATVCMGEPWRMPTSGECQELIDNTTYQWTTINGVAGYKLTSNLNGNYVFFPAAGDYFNGLNNYIGLEVEIYTSTPTSILYFGTRTNIGVYGSDRKSGVSIRGVYDAKLDGYEYVDLGLPSGKLWATMNVGASSVTDYGNYYQYGAGATTYQNTNQYYTGTDELPAQYDTATQVMGGGWYTPTRADFQELINYTTYTNLTINGVYCGKFISKTDSSKFLIIPAGGRYANGSLLYANQEGLLWTSTPLYSQVYSLEFYVGTRGLSTDYDRKFGANIRGVHK